MARNGAAGKIGIYVYFHYSFDIQIQSPGLEFN